MKRWQNAEINCVDISATEHDWWPQPSLDGGYLGDGEVSGWFGEDDTSNPPAPTPGPIPTPGPRDDERTDRLS